MKIRKKIVLLFIIPFISLMIIVEFIVVNFTFYNFSTSKALPILIIITLIILGIYFLIVHLVANSISKSIELLKNGTEIIKKGDLDHKVELAQNDEIGELSCAFDKMRAAIKKSKMEFYRKIKRQTKELAKKKEELENKQKIILTVLKDVEKTKSNIEQEKNKMKAVLYSIGDGVFVIDKDYKITVFNQIASKISGYSQEEAIGKRYDDILKFINSKNKKPDNSFIKNSIEQGKIQGKTLGISIIKKDSSKTQVATTAAPLKDEDNNILGCVVIFRDTTKEWEIDKAKTEFVSLASHQLRTPLSSINWYTEMLLAGDAGKINKTQKKFLNEIYAGNQRMVALVNSLLNVSRIELGNLSIEAAPADFIKISESVINELLPKLNDKKIKLIKNYSKDLPLIKADIKLLRIILQNLLSNSIKYTPDKGTVSVEIYKDNLNIFIKISDTGYGIPKAQQSKIFTKLFRADNAKEKVSEGTGLGLYIIKAILDAVGGKIWFETKENKGTSFLVSIPLCGMKNKKGTKILS